MPDMRFAPAPVLLAQKASGGLNQSSVRGHNERLILDLMRRMGTMSRLEIGQMTGLSAQTVSVLVRALLAEGLLLEGATSKGRVGPPTTPFSLNPDGAFALGVYAGVRVMDACILDFAGGLRGTVRQPLDDATDIAVRITELTKTLLGQTEAQVAARCLGIGLGVNRAHWSRDAGIGKDGWHPGSGLDLVEGRLNAETGLPCFILDDTTSAATGHVLYGDQAAQSSFLYCHIGARTQMRVVLRGQAQVGYDEGLAALPGLSALEKRLIDSDQDASGAWMGNSLPETAAGTIAEWSDDLATRLAGISQSLLAFLDIPRLVLVTSLARTDADTLSRAIDSAHRDSGLDVQLIWGHNTQWAKASGAAACVLSDRFTPGWGDDAVTK